MSTDIVLGTHADGVLRCYHRSADGALSQTAQIVAAADFEPTALAQLIGDLSTMFEWGEISTGLSQPNHLQRTATGEIAHHSASETELLEALRTHGTLTNRQLGEIVLSPPITPAERDALRKRIERLVQSGQIERITHPSAHHRYCLPGAAPTNGHRPSDFRSRPRASYAERERRRVDVLAWLRAHPDSTASEVADEVFAHVPRDRIGKARKVLEQLEVAQLVRRTEHDDGPLTFAVIEPQSETDADAD